MRLLWWATVALAAPLTPGVGTAQSPTLTVTVQNNAPRVRSTGLLADGKFVGLMRSGFPLRLHYRLELWRVRTSWFDQFVREVSWDAVARNDPLADDFVLIRQGGAVSRYATPDELSALLAERCIEYLQAPVVRVAGPDTPFPYALEQAYLPDANRVARGIEKALQY